MDSFDLKNYILTEKIGFGSFGEVFKIQDKETEKIYAAKISTKSMDQLSDDLQKNMEREITNMCKIHHPAILKFIGFSMNDFNRENKPVIVTDFLPNGSLADVLDNCHRGLTPDQWNDTIKLIDIYGIAVAMSFLHSNNIIHRDLKPANILLNEYLFPILADFGLSKDENTEMTTTCVKGTPSYISPEIWQDNNYTEKCDVYAFAFILYEIYANEKPYKDLTLFRLAKKVISGERPDTSIIPKQYSKYVELIEQCWCDDPSERPSFDEIVHVLETEPGFIIDTIEEDDFRSYVNYITNSPKSFDKYVEIDHFNSSKTKIIKKVNFIKEMIYPQDQYDELSKTCQKLVEEAIEDTDKQYEVGYKLIKGLKGFPTNIKLGIKYLKLAIKGGSIDAVIYYNRLLIIGKKIKGNIEKAKNNLQKYDNYNDPNIIFLQAMIAKKEENYPKAIRLLKKSIKANNSEAMFEYGKMLYLGEGCEENAKKAKDYFEQAKQNGFKKSDKFLSMLEADKAKTQKSENKEHDKKIDLVFLIDGQNPSKLFYNALTSAFSEIATKSQNDYSKIHFRFGVVIFRDQIISLYTYGAMTKEPLICDLTNNISEVQSFLNDYIPTGGSIKLATDWACGYHALLEDISWEESAEKVVIQICNTPGHGRYYTMNTKWHKKYLDIPQFSKKNNFNKNFSSYKNLQDKQQGWFSYNISSLAERGIKFYCLNGNEIALYCFNKVSSLFKSKKGKKFVIKDLFGYTFNNSEDNSINTNALKDEISNFVSKVVESCSSNDINENDFEKNCFKKFKEDLDGFYRKNDTSFGSETTDEDDDRDDNDNDVNNNDHVNNTGRNKYQTQKNHRRYHPRNKPVGHVMSHEQQQIRLHFNNINDFFDFVRLQNSSNK